jgi:hypothetical protein
VAIRGQSKAEDCLSDMTVVVKKILIAIAAMVAIAVLVLLAQAVRFKIWSHQRLYGKPRREWKQMAVTDIARRATNSAWLSNEVAAVAAEMAKPTDRFEQAWFSDHLLLMRSGEWMVYTNICSKQNGRIHDLFIGRGSDGKWYYSTFHFCIGMVVLQMGLELEGQPENLQKFVWAYYLREFDGRSDDCLQETWNAKLRRPRLTQVGGGPP